MSSVRNIASAGGVLPNNAIYEQIRVNGSLQFAVKEGKKISVRPMLTVGEHIVYQPLSMPPWFLAGKPVEYGSVEELWKEIRQYIYEHLDVEIDALYDVLTAWVICTWVMERFDSIGYLHFHGPRSSGKTRGLDILNYLSYRALLSPSVSGPAVFRALDEYHPTFLLDEFEMYDKVKESKAEVIGVVNAGYRRGQVVLRVRMKEGGGLLQGFTVFGPKALSSIKELPDALSSRCIRLPMTKAYRKIRVLIDKERAQVLRSKLLQYRLDHMFDDPPEGNPINLPDGRLIEIYYPLDSVAPTEVIKKTILAHAKSQYNRTVEEDRASIEAVVFSQLIDMLEVYPRVLIPQFELRDRINDGVTNPKERFGNKRLGSMLQRLNLAGKTVKIDGKRKRAIVVDPDVLERRKQRYYLVEELERVDKVIERVREAARASITSISSINTLFSEQGRMPRIDAQGATTPQRPNGDIIGTNSIIDDIDVIDVIDVSKPISVGSLQEKMEFILGELSTAQDSTSTLELSERMGVPVEEVDRILAKMDREGVIFSPQIGYWKKS